MGCWEWCSGWGPERSVVGLSRYPPTVRTRQPAISQQVSRRRGSAPRLPRNRTLLSNASLPRQHLFSSWALRLHQRGRRRLTRWLHCQVGFDPTASAVGSTQRRGASTALHPRGNRYIAVARKVDKGTSCCRDWRRFRVGRCYGCLSNWRHQLCHGRPYGQAGTDLGERVAGSNLRDLEASSCCP